jgi:transposase-like protein
MPSGELGVSADVVREAVRIRVAGSSLREVAKEVGIAHQSLHSFLEGKREPYGKNLGKLREWYSRATNEVVRLRQEVEALKRRLAACEAKLGRKR